ncbi:MAG: TRAM domain-containing protein [Candidatus Aenigmatarchaeota archaeon]
MAFGRGFKKFGFRVEIPKPVKVGEEYDVEINEVGAKGDGIARIKNFVVFVAGTKQGDKTRIKIKEVKNRFAIGEKIAESKETGEEG